MSDENETPSGDSMDDAWAAAMQEQEGSDDSGVEDDWANAMAEQAGDDVSRHEADQLEETFQAEGDMDLSMILDIPVTISMEIGRTRINIRNLLQLSQGSIVELDRLAGEPLDVLVNGTLIAQGEVVVVNEKFGIRLTDVISPAERVKKLK